MGVIYTHVLSVLVEHNRTRKRLFLCFPWKIFLSCLVWDGSSPNHVTDNSICRTPLSLSWYRTDQIDAGMKLSLWLAGILLTVVCALMFALVLDGEPLQDQSLAVLNAFLAYPVVSYSAFSFYQVFKTGHVWSGHCWTATSTAALFAFSTTLPAPSRAVSTLVLPLTLAINQSLPMKVHSSNKPRIFEQTRLIISYNKPRIIPGRFLCGLRERCGQAILTSLNSVRSVVPFWRQITWNQSQIYE